MLRGSISTGRCLHCTLKEATLKNIVVHCLTHQCHFILQCWTKALVFSSCSPPNLWKPFVYWLHIACGSAVEFETLILRKIYGLNFSMEYWPMLKPSLVSLAFLLSCLSSWFNRLPTIWQKNGDRICNIWFCTCNSAKSARRNSQSGRYRTHKTFVCISGILPEKIIYSNRTPNLFINWEDGRTLVYRK